MSKKHKHKNNYKLVKSENKKEAFSLRRFLFPKDWQTELKKGMIQGSKYHGTPANPFKFLEVIFFTIPFWIGKGVRRIIDPFHKMQLKKKKSTEV